MDKTKKRGNVTIANIISLFGLVLLLVFTFAGHSYQSGGELAWDAFTAVTLTVLAAFLLWFLIKAKGAENRLEQWRCVEIGLLVAYVLLVVPLSFTCGIPHFFSVNAQKERYKQMAQTDAEKVRQLFADYETFENNAISQTEIGLENAIGKNQDRDAALQVFMRERNIESREVSVSNFVERQREMLLGNGYKRYREEVGTQFDTLLSIVNGWNMLEIPVAAQQFEKLSRETAAYLTQLSQSAELPKVERKAIEGDNVYPNAHNDEYEVRGSSYRNNKGMTRSNYDGLDPRYHSYRSVYYTIVQENQTKDFELLSRTTFAESLRNGGEFSWTAAAFLLLVHALILLNYLVAYRTRSLGLRKKRINDNAIRI